MTIDTKHPAPGTILDRPDIAAGHGRWDKSDHRQPWQTYNAVDVWLYPGTPIVAPEPGQVSPGGWGFGMPRAGSPFKGRHLHLVVSGAPFVFYFTGLRAIAAKQGERVSKGDVIGYSGIINNVPRLHFAVQSGYNPADYVRDAYWLNAPKGGRNKQAPKPGDDKPAPGGPTGWGPDSTSGDNGSLPDDIEAAWHALEFALRVTWPTSAESVKSATRDVHKAVYS